MVTDNLIKRTLVALVDAQIRYVVCGGVACILQGVARATHDLDIRVVLESPDLDRLIVVIRSLGLTPRIPEPLDALLDPERRRVWQHEKNAVVYTVNAPSGAFALDIFLTYPIAFDDLSQSADTFLLDGRSVLVSCKRHLIEAKRAVQPPRKVDQRDIEDLLALLDG